MTPATTLPDAPHHTLEVVLWTLPVAYAMHVMEEFAFNWAGWANAHGLAFSWGDFAVTNGAVLAFGLAAAAIGTRRLALSLSYPALMAVNGLLLHLLPSLLALRPNPGALTAVALFLPLSAHTFALAHRAGATRRDLGWAFAVATLAQGFPLLLLGLRPHLGW